ncbi:MAG: hypothetical protein ABJB98_00430 [Actinomycetota bacterium]
MLSVGWLVAAVVLAVLLTVWVTFTLTRLDRLHARVDAAQAALDAQLVRRAAALLQVVESGAGQVSRAETGRYERTVSTALNAAEPDREGAENQVGRAIAALADQPANIRPTEASELHEACVRVGIARRFYNDAVRDTRNLRSRRMPRILHLAGHRGLPQFFDIDDTLSFPAPPNTHPSIQEAHP